jgi:hypothetical protein
MGVGISSIVPKNYAEVISAVEITGQRTKSCRLSLPCVCSCLKSLMFSVQNTRSVIQNSLFMNGDWVENCKDP